VPKTADPGSFTGTLTGGTIPDGTYQLTGWTEYGTSNAGSTKNTETFVISGNTVEGVVTPNGTGNGGVDIGGTFETSTNQITVYITCPQTADIGPRAYGLTGNGYEVFDSQANRLQMYTKM